MGQRQSCGQRCTYNFIDDMVMEEKCSKSFIVYMDISKSPPGPISDPINTLHYLCHLLAPAPAPAPAPQLSTILTFSIWTLQSFPLDPLIINALSITYFSIFLIFFSRPDTTLAMKITR